MHDPVVCKTDSGNYDLVQTGHSSGGDFLLLDRAKKAVVYVMEYEVRKLGSITYASQVKIWHNDLKKYKLETIGQKAVPAHVFDFLIKTYDAVITDRLQTEAGKGFWMNRLREAFATGKHVYSKLPDYPALQALEGHIWGDSVEYMNRRVAISKVKIW